MKNLKTVLVFLCLCVGVHVHLKAQSDNKQSEKDEIVEFADQQPEYPGGYSAMERFIQEHLTYPVAAIDKNIQGTVFLKFIVRSDGRLNDVTIVKDIGGGCGDEGKKVVESMPAWNPGKMNGKPVSTPVLIPIRFILRGSDNPVDSLMANLYKKPEGAVYGHLDKKPSFPGGNSAMKEFLKTHVQYPAAAKKAGIKGKVIISAIIDKDGHLLSPQISKDPGYACGIEAINAVIAMPKWIPGKRNGQAVNSTVQISVKFPPR